MSDPLCVCGHRASNHAIPDSGDTRCLAVEVREDLLFVFDDGRDGAYGYCACLRFTPAQPALATGGLMPLRATRTIGTGDGWESPAAANENVVDAAHTYLCNRGSPDTTRIVLVGGRARPGARRRL